MAIPHWAVLTKHYMKNLIPLMALWAFVACKPSVTSEAEEPHQHNEEAISDHHDQVHLLQRQMEVMDIQLGQFQQLDLRHTIKSNGRLELPPQKRAEVTALLGGRVKSIEVFPGRFVKEGQLLALLEQPEFIDLQQMYLSARSQVNFLQSDYERKVQLAKDSLSSTKLLEQAKSAYESARAEKEGAAAKLMMLGVSPNELEAKGIQPHLAIKAPISGYIRRINISIGTYVQAQQSMFELVDNDHIHIDLMVYEKDMGKVAIGQEVVFSITGKPDSVFHGKIFAIGKAFEEGPRAMQVHAEIDNLKGGLLPGMYVDARIVTEKHQVNALPEDAIVTNGGLSYIFVEEHPHEDDAHSHDSNESVFHMVEVATGAHDMGFVEVVPTDALNPDDLIVTKGAYYLLAEYLKSQGGAEHHH